MKYVTTSQSCALYFYRKERNTELGHPVNIFATLKQTRGVRRRAPLIFYFLPNITVLPVFTDSRAASRILTTVTLFSKEYRPCSGTLILPRTTSAR